MNITTNILAAIGLLLFSACTKKADIIYPDGHPDTRLNLYLASDAVPLLYEGYSANSNRKMHVYVGVNTGETPNRYYPDFPLLNESGSTWPRQTDKQTVNFTRYNAGTQTLFFADTANRVVHEQRFDLLPETFHCVYLTDDMARNNGEPVYASLNVSEARKGESGKTIVRFLHLSADAGELKGTVQSPNGSNQLLTQPTLNFLQASEPQAFGRDAANENGIMRFDFANESNNTRLTIGVPYTDGANYTVVIKGFVTEQIRTLGPTTVTVPANFRSEVRRIY